MVKDEHSGAVAGPSDADVSRGASAHQQIPVRRVSDIRDVPEHRQLHPRLPGADCVRPDGGIRPLVDAADGQGLTVRREGYAGDLVGEMESTRQPPSMRRALGILVSWFALSDGAACPWANTLDPVNSNPCDVSGRGILHRRELHSGPNVDLGQPL